MRIVIVGCGRLGAILATNLDQAQNDVVVIDTNSRAFRRLAPGYRGDTVIGTGIDEDVLRKAGIETADVFMAVTEGDNRNIFAAQVAKLSFNVPQVFARIYDPIRAETYRKLGIDVICPTTTMAGIVLDAIEAAQPDRSRGSEA
jgi:trk system potassium uptake protein TrkA